MASKSTLIVCRHSPYASGIARAALDTALAASAFEQPVELLFVGDGVLQLLPEQDGRVLGKRDHGRQLNALPLYDIERVYVDVRAAEQYQVNLSATALEIVPVEGAQLRELLAEADHLLGF